MKTIVVAHPGDTREVSTSPLPVCHLAYRIGREGRLYRSGLGLSVRGGLMAISDAGVSDDTQYDGEVLYDIKAECDARGFDSVVCDFERGANVFTTRFVYEAAGFFKGIKLFVPEAFASATGSANIMVSSAVTGGSCEEQYQRVLMRYGQRAALVYEPVCIDFIMPAPRGREDFVTPEQMQNIFRRENAVGYFSRELCANYFTYRDGDGKSHFALYDDQRSMLRKLSIARQCGFGTAFVAYPDVKGCMDELG